jgi:selT/selW/selH-like putative selenoprotein
LADAIQERYEVPTRLIKGSRGAFDVCLDGDLVFSKHDTGRFPDPGEVEEMLAGRLGA